MDTMKRKQFIKGTEQIAQEGAIQIFRAGQRMEEVIVGVVGTLQFDVFQYRMRSEYGVELRMTGLPYEQLRFIPVWSCPRPRREAARRPRVSPNFIMCCTYNIFSASRVVK
jgi:peptide chain release factor 3